MKVISSHPHAYSIPAKTARMLANSHPALARAPVAVRHEGVELVGPAAARAALAALLAALAARAAAAVVLALLLRLVHLRSAARFWRHDGSPRLRGNFSER